MSQRQQSLEECPVLLKRSTQVFRRDVLPRRPLPLEFVSIAGEE